MSIKLKGSSDGSVSFDAPADTSPSGSDITLTLPTSAGSADQFLKNSGIAGELEYSSMVENSSGNVGIGTSNPIGDLSVVASGGSGMEFQPEIATDTNRITNFNRSSSTYNNFRLDAAQQEFLISGSEKARLDTSGRLLVGTTSSKESNSNIQCIRASDATISIFSSNTNASGQAKINLGPSNNITGAQILCDAEEDFSVGANRTGRLSFTTRKDGTIVERMRLTSAGYFKAANNASYYAAGDAYHEFNQSGTSVNMLFRTTATNTAATQVQFGVARAATSAFWFLQGVSSWGSSFDTEFYIRGDGNAFADGSWSGGGADYAEYFEWSDGNTEAEDRRGVSVVLDGDKIREAVAGEDPIGVISGNPSVVGDADVDRWKGKYLRDDYGSYVLDEDGYRQLNPDYDSSVEYVQREDRPEWDTVGLMGKLRIRKGQVTGARWIKMRDVSDTVEEWLVR